MNKSYLRWLLAVILIIAIVVAIDWLANHARAKKNYQHENSVKDGIGK